jgi:ribosomal protein S18 acetylase RimI-like enzyme
LPVYCIGAGIGLHAISRLPGEIRWWRDIVGAVVIGGLAISQLASYAQSAEEWSTAKYGRTFVDVKHFAPYVDQLLAPGETFFEWGDESGFYYYTRRSPPSRFLYLCIAVAPSTQRAQHEQDLLDDLRRSQPELLITYARYTVYPDSLALPMTQWMSERYRRLADDPRRSPFALFVRVGGAVERRLQAASSSD